MKLLLSITNRMENKKMKKEKKIKDLKPSAYDMTDEEVAKSVDLELSDFDDSGDLIDETLTTLWRAIIMAFSYPIWNKITACIYKSGKSYGVKNTD